MYSMFVVVLPKCRRKHMWYTSYVTRAETTSLRIRNMQLLGITLIYIDHPVSILGYCSSRRETAHEQIIAMEQST
jgi:hypothetical protein